MTWQDFGYSAGTAHAGGTPGEIGGAIQVAADLACYAQRLPKPLTLKGVITKVDWINPHVYLHLDVKEADGTVTSWALSTLPTAMMRRAGLTKETLQGKQGEVVTITAIAARDETKHLGWISKITYADGHHVQLGRD
jgi:hypothetical protein